MPESDAYREPLRVEVFEDFVVIAAPEGPAIIALTPEAALESAERISEAARALIAERRHIR